MDGIAAHLGTTTLVLDEIYFSSRVIALILTQLVQACCIRERFSYLAKDAGVELLSYGLLLLPRLLILRLGYKSPTDRGQVHLAVISLLFDIFVGSCHSLAKRWVVGVSDV